MKITHSSNLAFGWAHTHTNVSVSLSLSLSLSLISPFCLWHMVHLYTPLGSQRFNNNGPWKAKDSERELAKLSSLLHFYLAYMMVIMMMMMLMIMATMLNVVLMFGYLNRFIYDYAMQLMYLYAIYICRSLWKFLFSIVVIVVRLNKVILSERENERI